MGVLVNREKVGYPNEFDVNLLGNCDDVCCTLVDMLKWEWMRPIRQSAEEKDEAKEQAVDGGSDGDGNGNGNGDGGRNEIKPIATESCKVESVKHRYVPPCYYLF